MSQNIPISSIEELVSGTKEGRWTICDIIEEVIQRRNTCERQSIWIEQVNDDTLINYAKNLDVEGCLDRPLWGVPFAVKDNIDVDGYSTTAGCPSYAYTPNRSAHVVQKLLDAGAILVGKTNMDQFATGLVGTRSPYGVCRNVYNPDYISGGSSSGSAVCVGLGLVSFSLGTDTAGSGRVPASFNNLVGVKPTRGVIGASGIVPACKSLDCVSIFANTVADGYLLLDVCKGLDSSDPYSREISNATGNRDIKGIQNVQSKGNIKRIGVPLKHQRQFFGDLEAAQIFSDAIKNLNTLQYDICEIDFTLFFEAAKLLYEGPWVCERDVAVGDFIQSNPSACESAVRSIIASSRSYSARNVFEGFYRLEELKSRLLSIWSAVDLLMTPTTPTIYRVEEVLAEPLALNSRLGFYTNFVNLLDLCACAVPAGWKKAGVPFGVTFIGPTFSDFEMAAVAKEYEGTLTIDKPIASPVDLGDKYIDLVVLGAHLSGQPLNYQLTSRGAYLLSKCRTAPCYQFYALAQTTPEKPGLVRVTDGGVRIEVEVWRLSVSAFGSFVNEVPAPLTIGTIELDNGRWVNGFLCEPVALECAVNISRHGGWLNYLANR